MQVVVAPGEAHVRAVRLGQLGDPAADPPRADDEKLLPLEALADHEVRPPLPSSRRRSERSPSTIRRRSASMRPIACSAVAFVRTPGVFETTTPRSRVAERSMLSSPTA